MLTKQPHLDALAAAVLALPGLLVIIAILSADFVLREIGLR